MFRQFGQIGPRKSKPDHFRRNQKKFDKKRKIKQVQKMLLVLRVKREPGQNCPNGSIAK